MCGESVSGQASPGTCQAARPYRAAGVAARSRLLNRLVFRKPSARTRRLNGRFGHLNTKNAGFGLDSSPPLSLEAAVPLLAVPYKTPRPVKNKISPPPQLVVVQHFDEMLKRLVPTK